MLSNLATRSNILPEDYPQWLPRLAATDLHDIKERCPLLGIDFNPQRYSLTVRQQGEWDARLSWGDKTITMGHEDRAGCWARDALGKALAEWDAEKLRLDIELAFEWLWLCHQAIMSDASMLEKIAPIVAHLKSYLNAQGLNDDLQKERLREISGG